MHYLGQEGGIKFPGNEFGNRLNIETNLYVRDFDVLQETIRTW